MWIVRLALQRPYTFIVMALLILILSPIVILRTPVDIFPEINIPVISIIWQFTGLSPQEMTDRIVSNTERGLTTTVNDIEHVETQAMDGRAITKVFFHPTANLQIALSQVTAISQTAVQTAASGDHAATHHCLFGVQRPDRADWSQQQISFRTGAE